MRKLARLAREAIAEGFHTIKIKVGHRIEDDVRRCRIAREAIDLSTDWPSMQPALGCRCIRIAWLRELQSFTSPGSRSPPAPTMCWGMPHPPRASLHAVSTGEHTHNRVLSSSSSKRRRWI